MFRQRKRHVASDRDFLSQLRFSLHNFQHKNEIMLQFLIDKINLWKFYLVFFYFLSTTLLRLAKLRIALDSATLTGRIR